MNFTSFALKVAILFIPGVFSLKTFKRLTGTQEKKDWEDIIEIAFLSIISYLILSIIQSIKIGLKPLDFSFSWEITSNLTSITSEVIQIEFVDIIYATAIGFAIAFPIAYVHTNDFINKVGLFLGVTLRDSNSEVWWKFLSLYGQKYVLVRDLKLSRAYFGKIDYYSSSEEKRELIMSEVSVYDNEMEFKFELDQYYLSRKTDELEIELHNYSNEEGDSNEADEASE